MVAELSKESSLGDRLQKKEKLRIVITSFRPAQKMTRKMDH
jgi:hypothetical protein